MTGLLSAWAHAGTLPSVQECVAASGAGQEHLKQGALFAARRDLEVCSAPSCPQLVSGDCTRWLEEVIAAMPSINIVVRVNGVDQSQAAVKLDGAPWLDRLTGRPQDIEPGEHEVVVEAGGVQQLQKLVVVQGEKNRVVLFQLTGVVFSPLTPEVSEPTTPVVTMARGFPTWPVVFSSLTVVGAAGFTAFGLAGKARLAKVVADPCASTKTCNPAETAAVSREFVVADVSLVVGIASAIAAGGFWWWWAGQPSGASVTVIPTGNSLQVVGTW